MQLYKRLLLNLLLIFTTLVSSTIFVTTALAVQVSVPSAPGAGYYLISTSTGNYVASSSPVIAPLTITGTGTLGCAVASGSQAGCLSSTDWNTFNNKGGSSASSTLLSDVNTWSGFNNFTAGLGVGTTTLGKLSIHLNPTDSTFWPFAFVIGSSTPTATTTLFSVSNTGLTTLPQLIITGSTTLPTNPPIGILEIGGGTTAAGVATGDAGLTEINSIIDTPYFSYGDYQNVLLQNEALNTTANWTSSVGVIGTNNAIAPDGTLIAENIPAGTLANDGIRQTVVNAVVGNWNLSAWMKSQNPTGTSSLEIDWGTGSATTTGTACVFNLTNQWRRYGCTQSVTAAHTQLDARVQSGTTAIAAFGVQLDFSTTTRAYSGPQTTGATASLTRTNHIRNSLSVNNALTIAGAFNGATTGTFTVTHSAQTLSVINNSVATDTLNIADGIFINNVSAASVATPNQASPRLHFNGRIWNGTASLPVDALMQLIPGSPINTLIPTTTLQIAMSYNGLSTTTPVTITANNVGIGSTSPYAQFAVHANANTQYPTRTLFAIGSSTATATTTLFSILNNGTIISSTTATSTFTNGLNLSGGCFAINSVCLSTSGGSSASSTLLGDTNTWSGSNTFSNLAAFNGGLTAYASTTIGDGTATGGLTINGTATTTGKLTTAGPFVVGSLPSTITPATGGIYLQRSSSPFVVLVNNTTQAGQFRSNATNRIGFTDGGGGTEFFSTVTSGTGIGNVAVGSTSPYAHFSIHANNGDTNQYLFAIGSSTASATTTLFSVDNVGNVVANVGTFTFAGGVNIAVSGASNFNGHSLNSVGLLGVANIAATGSTTLQNFTANNATTSQATTTNFAITGTANTLLKTLSNGAVVPAGAGTDYTLVTANTCSAGQFFNSATAAGAFGCATAATFGYPFTPLAYGSLTSSATSSVLYPAGLVTGTSTIGTLVASSSITDQPLATAAGTFIAADPTGKLIATTSPTGTNYWTSSGSNLFNNTGSFIGIGTSSPFAKFAIQANTGDTATTLFAIGSSTASATTTLFSIDNIGNLINTLGKEIIRGVSYLWPSSQGAANTVLTNDGSGNLSWGTPSAPYTTSSYVAAEGIVAGAPVALAAAPPAQIATDNTAVGTTNATTFTTSFTVGNNPNRTLVVETMSQNNSTDCTAATYNGVSMTLGTSNTSSSSHKTRAFYLFAPATGANNLVLTCSSASHVSYWVFSYYNTNQSTIGTTANIGDSANSFTLTTTVPFSLAVGVKYGTASFTGNGYTNNVSFDGFAAQAGDSGAFFLTTGTATWDSGTAAAGCAIEIEPLTANVTQAFLAGANVSAAFANSFIGFATAAATAGQTVTVATAGIVSTTTSLTVGSGYYLKDIRGTIGTSAGSNTKKVGMAVATSSMVITNTW